MNLGARKPLQFWKGLPDMKGSIAVLGNVNLDVICQPVDEVPRQDSIAFKNGLVVPGGCGSNVAIQLGQLGVNTLLFAVRGDDYSGEILQKSWNQVGVNSDFVKIDRQLPTGISVVLVDSGFQPRFLHTPGANEILDGNEIDIKSLISHRTGFLHIAGYFVLPGLLEKHFKDLLRKVKDAGIRISLDVVTSPAMETPDPLWEILPEIDTFLCNQTEAESLSDREDPRQAARWIYEQGPETVVVKLGAEGCFFLTNNYSAFVPSNPVHNVIDTTGAGDAFAAGFLAARMRGQDLSAACQAGNQTGARAVQHVGAVSMTHRKT